MARTILKLKRANQNPLAQAALHYYASSDGDALQTRVVLLLNGSAGDAQVKNLWMLVPIFWLLSLLGSQRSITPWRRCLDGFG